MVSIPKYFLFPFIIVCCILGVFTLNNRVFDIWVLMVFGLLGCVFVRFKVPMSPIIMGYLMGKTFETNFRRAMIAANGNFADIFTRPIATVFLVVSALFVVVPLILRLVRRARAPGKAA